MRDEIDDGRSCTGQKAVAKRRSLGSIIRRRLSGALKPSGRSLSAERADQQRTGDVDNLEPRRRSNRSDPERTRRPTPSPSTQPNCRTAVGKSDDNCN